MIPDDVVDWFREIFADVNRGISAKIHNVPNAPEPSLDLSFIEHLTHFAAPMVFTSGWAIQIDTHYLGGLAHWGQWEIADIGVFIFFQQRGKIVRRKVALLQSKRLYPLNNLVDQVEDFDYMLGMARIAERDSSMKPLSVGSVYDFSVDSRYQALKAGDKQQTRIKEFSKKTGWPVYFNFYNPPIVPLQVILPRNKHYLWSQNPPLGQRIIPFDPVAKMLAAKSPGQAPTLNDVDGLVSGGGDITFGWRLEDFFADMLLGCSEGKRFKDSDHIALDALFRRRSGPIAAAIAVTVDVGPDSRLPD